MTRRSVGSVRFRITVAVTLVFGVTLSLASVLFVHRVQDSMLDDVYNQDIATLDLFSKQLTSGEVPSVLNPVPNGSGTQIQVVDENGNIVSATPGAPKLPFDPRLPAGGPRPPSGNGQPGFPGQKPPLDAEGRPIAAHPNGPSPDNSNGQPRPSGPFHAVVKNPGVVNTSNGIAQDLAVSAVPVSTGQGTVRLIAATSLAGVGKSVDALVQALMLAIPLLVLGIALATWLTTGRALRPVAQITAQVEEITASTLHERVPEPRAQDEIAALAHTMNAMLERLESSATRQRQFVSDASHELRTPVASIKTELEVALLHPDQADWQAVARNVLAEDERLEQIVGDLLALARFDERPTLDPATASDVDLDDIIRGDAARTRRFPVDTSGVGSARVFGRPDELSRMIGHLLDNAARHATTKVRVSLGVTGGPTSPTGTNGRAAPPKVVVAIDDDGDGVPVALRQSIFERFGRLEEGRARDKGGAGLGLAVVKRIAERHGGSVSVAESPWGGARFEVILPLLED